MSDRTWKKIAEDAWVFRSGHTSFCISKAEDDTWTLGSSSNPSFSHKLLAKSLNDAKLEAETYINANRL